MKRLLFLTLLIVFGNTASAATPEEKYRKEFQVFMENSAVTDILPFIGEQLLAQIENQMPSAAEKVKEMLPEIERRYLEFVDKEFLPIYMEHVSYKDLRKANKFYRTRAGKNLVSSQSIIMYEVMQKAEIFAESLQDLLKEIF